ncbi:MAG: hypothetical protein ACP5VR_12150 [Acidimicrobiales bacterium]
MSELNSDEPVCQARLASTGHRGTLRVLRRALLPLAAIGALLGSSVAPAAAAGSPYVGPPVLPPTGVPGGFTKVFTAVVIPSTGRVVSGKIGGISLSFNVPPGAAPQGEQLVVTISDLSLVKVSQFRQVPKFVMHWRPVFALGVLFQYAGKPTANKKLVTIKLSSKMFHAPDYLVEYSPTAHGFVPFPKFHTYVADGEVLMLVPAGTELVVVAPPSSPKH